MLLGPHVLGYDFKDHIGTQQADARSADAGELLGDPVGEGVLKVFSRSGPNFLRRKSGLLLMGGPPAGDFFFATA